MSALHDHQERKDGEEDKEGGSKGGKGEDAQGEGDARQGERGAHDRAEFEAASYMGSLPGGGDSEDGEDGVNSLLGSSFTGSETMDIKGVRDLMEGFDLTLFDETGRLDLDRQIQVNSAAGASANIIREGGGSGGGMTSDMSLASNEGGGSGGN